MWSDKFNGTSIDASKWNQVGPWGVPVASHWTAFSYLTSNVSEANGLATITVQYSGGPGTWTGGVLSTDSTKLFQYGFFEVRAKLPSKAKVLASHLADGGKADMDIMEFLDGNQTRIFLRRFILLLAGR